MAILAINGPEGGNVMSDDLEDRPEGLEEPAHLAQILRSRVHVRLVGVVGGNQLEDCAV